MRGVMLSGLSGAAERGGGVIASDEHFEAYLSAPTLADVVREHHLREDLEGLVVLRPVAVGALPDRWPDVAPRMAIALDLLEGHDPRARQEGRVLLAKLEAALRTR